MRAPDPPDEVERLRVLHGLEVLDTHAEPVFDSLLRILARTVRSDVSLISLVDEDRQWFKASIGVSSQEMPRSVAFCGYTILSDNVLSIADATLDPRVADNPLVTGDMRIRSYLGAPIRVFNRRIGVVCAISRTPKAFNDTDMFHVSSVATAVADQLRSRRGFLRKARASRALQARRDGGSISKRPS